MFKALTYTSLLAAACIATACGSSSQNGASGGASTQSASVGASQSSSSSASTDSTQSVTVPGTNGNVTITTGGGNVSVTADGNTISVSGGVVTINGNVVADYNQYIVGDTNFFANANDSTVTLDANGCAAVIVNGNKSVNGQCNGCNLTQNGTAWTLSCDAVPQYGFIGGSAVSVDAGTVSTSSCGETLGANGATNKEGTCTRCSVNVGTGSMSVTCSQ